MTLRLVEGGNQAPESMDPRTRRRKFMRIIFWARLHFGKFPFGPRSWLAGAASVTVASVADRLMGPGWFWPAAAVVFAVVYYRSRAFRSWEEKLDQCLAEYDPLDKEAYRDLQANTRETGRFSAHCVIEWLDREHLALAGANRASRRPEVAKRFLRKKL